MTTVRKLLEAKETAKNFSVEASQTVLDALKVMAEAHIGAILVTENGKIIEDDGEGFAKIVAFLENLKVI